MQNTTIVWLSIDLMCNYEIQSDQNFDTYGFYIFSPEIICVHQIQFNRPQNKAENNDVSASLIWGKTYLMGFIFFFPNNNENLIN